MPRLIIVGVLILALVAVAVAQDGRVAPPGEIEVLRLRPNFYMVAGGGANVAVQVGEDGAVVVDSGSAASESVITEVICSGGTPSAPASCVASSCIASGPPVRVLEACFGEMVMS